jgi:AcrR family transcriptional regulator
MSLIELSPRKTPRQARSQATVAAIVDACGQVLAHGSYETLTTNHISERAGVSIGTLYEYFPNREAIVAALAADFCARLVDRMQQALVETVGMDDLAGVEHLLAAGVGALGARDCVFKVLLRETPFVAQLPVFHQAREALTELCQTIRVGSADRLNLPAPQADAWLISQMLFAAMLEIAFLEDETQREPLLHELGRLTFRMAVGRDPEPVAG